MYKKWMGTEESMLEVEALEAEVAELRKAAANSGDRQALFFLDDYEDPEEDKRMGSHLIEKIGDTAVLKVSGSLVNNHDSFHRYFAGRITSYEAIIGAVAIIASDEEVKRVVMRVGSGGGAVTGLSKAAKAISRLDARKAVTAHVDNQAFSAAYWLASAAREVVAGDEMSEFGSIGTIMVQISRNRMLEENGIDAKVFRSGEFKGIGNPMEALSDIGKKYLQADIDKANGFFLEHVAKRRGVSIGAKEVWGEGKTFFAAEAQAVGLVDRVEALDDLIVRFSGAQNHHNRSYGMKLSPEKLARIEAGASPKEVLSAAELKEYEAEIEANKDADTGAGEEADTGKEAGEDKEPKGDDADQDTGKSADASANDSTLRDLLKENGRLEARLEARDEQLEELKSKLTAQKETFESLMAIGIDAVNNRERALGKPQTNPSTSEGLISAYHSLSKEMSDRFNVGQRSAAVNTDEEPVEKPGIPRTLQLRRKGA